jgi:eukaryotic-like serine/threonine-protein kinase
VITSKAEKHASAEERLAPNWEGAVIGRYRIGPRLGAGGMGQVHLATMTGAAGFSRVVAIKRLHSEYSQDPRMRARFEREVRLSARIVHPNVVQVLDVIQSGDDLMFVMEYVAGDTLRALRAAARKGEHIPLDIVTGMIVPALHGLHAAHETRDAEGKRLLLVHRDFSPDNVMIGPDGEVKVLDFGIAKAAQEAHTTKPGSITGKLCYMSPEQALGLELDARSDVFAAGTVLWELLVGERLFRGQEASPAAILHNLLHGEIPPPSLLRRDVPEPLERVVMRALQRELGARFSNAREFALSLEAAVAPASAFSVGQSLQRLCGESLDGRAASLARFRSTLLHEPALTIVDALSLGASSADMFSGNDTFGEDALSESRPAVQRAPRRRAAKAWKMVGTLALLGSIAAATLRFWTGAKAPPQRPEPSRSQPSAVISGAPAGPREARNSSAPTPIASSLVQLSAQASASSSARLQPAARRPNRASNRRPTSAALACSPPTYVDAEGIRHFKLHCL